MKIKVQRTRRHFVEIEIDLPTYRYASWGDDNGSSEHWWKFTGDHVWEVSRREHWNGQVTWEIERERFTIGGSVLDDGSDDVEPCSADTFREQMEKAAAWIAEGIAA